MTTTEQPTVPQSTNPNRPACIANSNTSVGPEVTLWDCPCIECWRLAQDVTDECDRELYRDWRDDRTPPPPVVATETAHEATVPHPVTGQYHDVIVVVNDATNEIVSITPKEYGR
jgi:hypothetical protein